jgi:protein-disulfide isomerase
VSAFRIGPFHILPSGMGIVVLFSGLLMGLNACPPPCPQTAGARCAACPQGVQRPPAQKPDCAELCTYFTYCRARRWTPPKHLAKMILACTTQCKHTKGDANSQKIFDGIKTCSVNRSCVEMVSCLESMEAKIRASKPQIDPDAIYKVDVAASPTQGPPDALVTVVMFSDHQCGFCRRAYRVVKAALEKHPKALRLVYKHFPLPSHTDGLRSAQAATCVLKQSPKLFWAFHDKAMAAADLSQTELLSMAKSAGAKPLLVTACLKANLAMPAIKADLIQGGALGIDGTPTFYINGKRYPGYLTETQLDQAITEARARAEAATKSGVKPVDVYRHLTAKGATGLKYLPPKRPTPKRPTPKRPTPKRPTSKPRP